MSELDQLRRILDTEHDAECTGWHLTGNGERHCEACNSNGEHKPSGPPPWHTGPWSVDGVVTLQFTGDELDQLRRLLEAPLSDALSDPNSILSRQIARKLGMGGL